MTDVPTTARRPRADAQRNRERILEAADAAFREEGLDVSVAEIARRAEVGSGTLFRNFPTKDDLVRAIIEMHMNRWIDTIQAAIAAEDTGAAFGDFFESAVFFNYRDRGMLEAVKGGLLDNGDLYDCKCQALGLSEELVARAKNANVLRTEITTEDIYALASGAAESAHAAVREGIAEPSDAHKKYVAIILAGLRP
jgi:AcrR family transcriptional regulator